VRDLLSWPALVFFIWLAGYIATALLIPSVLREERIDLPPTGVALMLIMLTAWPAIGAMVALNAITNRDR
jgi:hypothetical protein